MRVLTLLILFFQLVVAQTRIYEIPFASIGNALELTIANASSIPTSNIMVEAVDFPAWLRFPQTEQRFDQLDGGEEVPATFLFSVDKSAPVHSPHTLRFIITNSNGESWTKEISISVSPPEKFELFQNYPNPFNPTTTISYQLPHDAKVNLRIYDILGREVATLVDENRPAGYHEERWDASRFASGMYIYQLTLTDQRGNRQAFRKTMALVK